MVTPGGVLTRRGAAPRSRCTSTTSRARSTCCSGLISKHKLDITEIALASVTDEFIAHIRRAQAADTDWDLGQATEFLLVAATLLDLKAARLLPQSAATDDEDFALHRGPRPALRAAAAVPRVQGHRRAFADRMATAGG